MQARTRDKDGPLIMSRFSFLFRLPVLLFLVHVYVAWRLALGMPQGELRWGVVLMLVLVYLVLMTGFLARDRVGVRAADALSWAGFLMLGFFSWLFVLTVLRDVLLGITFFLRFFLSLPHAPWLENIGHSSTVAVIGCSVAACVIGFFHARRLPVVVDVDIAIPGLAPAFDGFCIAQVTDLHVGPTIKKHFVQRVVGVTNSLRADVVVLTGDLVDGSVERLQSHTRPLSGLEAPHGVYVVTGNHEYYVGAEPWVAEFTRLGLDVLLNEHRIIKRGGHHLVLAGVTDFGAEKFIAGHKSDPEAALQDAPQHAGVKILLAHQPRSMFAAAPLGFDLQLSGHTHGGQFWPWNNFVPMQQPFVAGLHRYLDMQVYVSRGTGYWGPPLRLGSRSEITYIRLHKG